MAPTPTLLDLADRLRAGLESGAVSELIGLLAEDVTWGDCGGRDTVAAFLEPLAGTVDLEAASVTALDDRLAVELGFGDHSVHLAVFERDGLIGEICDAGSPGLVEGIQPVGPLDVAASQGVGGLSVAVVFPVRSLSAAVDHYRELGFEVHAFEGDAAYAYASFDAVNIHLAGDSSHDPLTSTSVAYMFVTNADALYARWRLADVPGRLVAPVDTDYGLREGAHVDPDGNLIRFGAPL